ncbi:MAG: hypothetical protein KGY53_06925 [Wenzhouxiangellaceae bacterium]|nr:hypothetical protein [Wenzhouxiangellaceae bacterium]
MTTGNRRSGNRPHFFIVGAPKCGTTSMAQYLNQHPEIFVLRGEPHFFGSDIEYNKPRLSPKQYAALCHNAGGKRLCGDRSTWYLYSKTAATEIQACHPDALIIAMLRHPAEMLHSLHAHHHQRGRRDDIEDLGEALAAEPERRRGERIPVDARFVESLYYSEIARYSEQLQRYFDAFGRERVKIILFDDLKADPGEVYAETLDFLDVDPAFVPDFDVHNASAPTSDGWLYRRWKASTLRYRMRSLLPQGLYNSIRGVRKKRLQQAAQRQPRAPLDTALRIRLVEQFAPEIDRLEALIGRDLSPWRR